MNVSPQSIEKEFSSMDEPFIESINDDQFKESVTREKQTSEQKKRIVKTITENIRVKAQSLGRLVKKRKEKI